MKAYNKKQHNFAVMYFDEVLLQNPTNRNWGENCSTKGKVADSDSDSVDELNFGEGSFQEANDNMYSQCLRMRDETLSSVSDNLDSY